MKPAFGLAMPANFPALAVLPADGSRPRELLKAPGRLHEAAAANE